MDLLLPEIGILLCTLFALGNLLLAIIAFVLLVNNKNFDSRDRPTFAIGIILLPVAGSITYFYVAGKRRKLNAA